MHLVGSRIYTGDGELQLGGGGGWLERTVLDRSRHTRSVAGQKVIGNEMQPTNFQHGWSRGPGEQGGYIPGVNIERKVASCTPFPR